MKKLITLLALLLLSVSAWSQSVTIQGTVLGDEGNGQPPSPVIGAAVLIKGSSNGVVTDASGHYTIKAKVGDELVITSLGFEDVTLRVGKTTKVDVTMKTASQTLSESVVTALGITREEKSLGYAVSKVEGGDIVGVEGNNWLNGLQGKVAGLNLDASSAGPASSVRVTLRGESSLSHDNNTALFVVDGVPIDNSMSSNASGSSYENSDAPIDYGNGAADINPDEIESISVLKGPSATALYGSRAANGAIVITTKKGKKTQGVGVSFASAFTLDVPGFWPDFQNEYGPGSLGSTSVAQNTVDGVTPNEVSWWTVTADRSDTGKRIERFMGRQQWGEKIEGQMRYLYKSYDWDTNTYTRVPYENQDWFKGFFQTGTTFTNTLTVDASSGKGESMRVSVKDIRNRWISPNTGYNSQYINFSASSSKNKYIKADTKFTYMRKNSDNLPVGGYSASSALKSIMWKNGAVGVDDMYNEYISGRIGDYFNGVKTTLIDSTLDNPYFIAYEHLNTQNRDRVYGNTSLTITFIPKKLDLMLRGGMDLNNDFRTQRRPYHSMASSQGMYREQTVRKLETNLDFLLSYKNKYTSGISLNASLGGNTMTRNSSDIRLSANQLDVEGVYMLSNVKGQLETRPRRWSKSVNSLYAVASVGFRDYAFIDITGRNDWSSTLAPGLNSYFYPSVSASVLLNEIFHMSRKKVDLLKFRASWANVGNDTEPYQLIDTYAVNAAYGNSYELASSLKNYDLKPENVESWEVGLEGKFLKGLVDFDLAYYDSKTTNQIISVPSDWISGASRRFINAGCVTNKGVEVSAVYRPIQKKNAKLSFTLNWSKNWNKLVELAPGVDVWQLNDNTIGSRVLIYAYPGSELGRIYGTGYERAPKGAFYYDENGKKVNCEGQAIVNKDTGNPILSERLQDLGSIYPDWKGGLQIKGYLYGVSVAMNFAASYGGKAYSLTNAILSYHGKITNTLYGRYDGVLHEGVNLLPDGTYAKNTTITTDVVDYYSGVVWHRNNVEQNTFDTSYLKLKDVNVSYSLPSKIVKKTKVLQKVSFGATVTNVFCLTTFPQFDPEVVALAGSSLYRGVETGSYPMTRAYTFNLKLDF